MGNGNAAVVEFMSHGRNEKVLYTRRQTCKTFFYSTTSYSAVFEYSRQVLSSPVEKVVLFLRLIILDALM